MDLRYESLITGRTESLLAVDMEENKDRIVNAIQGSRIAVVGAAGSIGSAVVKILLRFRPAALTLIDLSENNLVELVRDLRSSAGLRMPDEFLTLPIGMGSIEELRVNVAAARARPMDAGEREALEKLLA